MGQTEGTNISLNESEQIRTINETKQNENIITVTTIATRSATPSATPTLNIAATQTPIPTSTLTPTITPTYSILRGVVNVNALSCKYGPGPWYLFKYGVYEGDYLEIFGRNHDASWLLIRAIGGTNACWVKASYMEIEGDPLSLAPAEPHAVLPKTYLPSYYHMTGVTAWREGDKVNLMWNPIYWIAGDNFDTSSQALYIVEVWTCQNGRMVEQQIGVWDNQTSVIDQEGCSDISYGRVLGAEKHGYTEAFYFVWP